MLDFAGEIGAMRSAIDREAHGDIYGARVDSLYASLRELQKAYVIAQRSYDLSTDELLSLRSITDDVVDQCKILSEKRVLLAELETAATRYSKLADSTEGFRRYIHKIV